MKHATSYVTVRSDLLVHKHMHPVLFVADPLFVPTTISWKSADVLIIYAMSLLACGTLVPASLHKYDIGHLGHESFQSITCTDITDNQTNVSFLFRYCKIFLVAICNTRYSTTEKQFSTNVKVPLSCVVVLQRCRTTI